MHYFCHTVDGCVNILDEVLQFLILQTQQQWISLSHFVFLSKGLADCFFLSAHCGKHWIVHIFISYIHSQLGNLKHIWSVNQIHATHTHAHAHAHAQAYGNSKNLIMVITLYTFAKKKWALWILEKSIVYNEIVSPVGWKYS